MEVNDSDSNENQKPNANESIQMDATVQQMTHGFVDLFEKELDQVQSSLKEALTKQEKMGIELERLNVEHAMESRQDCQELKRSDNLLKYRDKELNILRQKQIQEEDLIAKSSPSNK